MPKPTVFIGCSFESLEIARTIQSDLESDADITMWTEDDFVLGNSTFESLMNVLERHDFAVCILAPDDITEIRGTSSFSPREKVVFELGLFVGRLGRGRTVVVYDQVTHPRITIDLAGIILEPYDGTRISQNPKAALENACNRIRDVITKQSRNSVLQTPVSASQKKLTGTWTGEVEQIIGKNSPLKHNIELVLDANKEKITGTFTLGYAVNSSAPSGIEWDFEFEGSFIFEQFLRLEYQMEDRGVAQLGLLFLQRNALGLTLKGTFAGHGSITEGPVAGTVMLQKM